jgi:hypothetical protein
MNNAMRYGVGASMAVVAVLVMSRSMPDARAQTTSTKTLHTFSATSVNARSDTAITKVVVWERGTAFWVTITGSGAPFCTVYTPTLTDALALRAQVNSAQTTDVTCGDTGTTVPQLSIPVSPSMAQTFQVSGGP